MARPKGSGLIHRLEDYADEVCEWLASGKFLTVYCRQEGKPSRGTILRWMNENPAFAEQVARARDTGYEVLAESVIEIADDKSGDVVVDEKGNVKQDAEFAARSRLRVDARLKLLSCWKPSRYGQKVAVGGDADAPPIRVLSATERLHRLQAIIGAAQTAAPAALPAPADDIEDLLS